MGKQKKEKLIPDGFPERFKEFLNHFGLNYNSLGEEVPEVGSVQFWRYGTAKSEPGIGQLGKVADKYPINIHWLITGKGNMLTTSETPEGKIQDDEAARLIAQLRAELKESKDEVQGLREDKEVLSIAVRKINFLAVTRNTTGAIQTSGRDVVLFWRADFSEKPVRRMVRINQWNRAYATE